MQGISKAYYLNQKVSLDYGNALTISRDGIYSKEDIEGDLDPYIEIQYFLTKEKNLVDRGYFYILFLQTKDWQYYNEMERNKCTQIYYDQRILKLNSTQFNHLVSFRFDVNQTEFYSLILLNCLNHTVVSDFQYKFANPFGYMSGQYYLCNNVKFNQIYFAIGLVYTILLIIWLSLVLYYKYCLSNQKYLTTLLLIHRLIGYILFWIYLYLQNTEKLKLYWLEIAAQIIQSLGNLQFKLTIMWNCFGWQIIKSPSARDVTSLIVVIIMPCILSLMQFWILQFGSNNSILPILCMIISFQGIINGLIMIVSVYSLKQVINTCREMFFQDKLQVLKNTLLLLLVFSILDLIYTIFYYYTIISYDISFYWTYNWAIYQGWDILMLPFIIMWCYIWRVNTNSYLLLNQDNERFEETKCEDMQQIEITEINNV